MQNFLTIFFVVLGSYLSAQQMRIGVFYSKKISNLTLQVSSGEYRIFGDTTFLNIIGSGESINFKASGSTIFVTQTGRDVGRFKKVSLIPVKNNSSLKYSPKQPVLKARIYEDGVDVSIAKSRLRIVNIVDMEDYLSGVIESEGGGGKHLDYYKVQAVMSRTYALKNKKRHHKESFELCDGIHCQAYHKKLTYTPIIRKAVKETQGEVLVDANNQLVTSYFSANCGGQTTDASYVWNTSVPYIESFIDTFCIHTRQATWTKKISKSSWKSFLNAKFSVTEEQVGDLLYNFEQEQRKAFYIHPSLGIPLRDIRKKFRLKSIFFSSHLEGEYVVLEGRGFGHGVGLCQEGAMNMATNEFSYRQIARFYFKDVRVINYYKVLYFDQENIEGERDGS
tara:strand:+ start:2875 stop:4053 length:1179 start_codon:yes stop_codon:yes gene_type:complete